MSGVWIKNEGGWKTAASQKFGLEKDLHELAEENIHMLPLAGSPNLVVIGSEVSLGSGWADLLAVETMGRPVIIEVKLARNAEARRAIVAQALSYAAWLRGSKVEDLERGPLRGYLRKQGHGSILEAVQAQDQQSEVDKDAFAEAMQEYLSSGAFRLVLLLDETSVELERIVAYLDAVTRKAITIDLKPYVSLWRSVFERRAPNAIAKVEQINGKEIGKGSSATVITRELLDALTDAYREATAS